jgi:Tol biopolymer transport system component
MRADGTEIDRVRAPNTRSKVTYDWAPASSPDGAQIAFSSSRNGPNTDVYVMNPNGGNVTPVTNDAVTDVVSDWKRPR